MDHMKQYSHRSKQVLKTFYRNEEWEQKSIAEFFDVDPSTISNLIHEHDLQKYGPGWRGTFCLEGCSGYPRFMTGSKSVHIHQLVAIAEGAAPEKVFGRNGYSIHHKNGCKLDNRPENIELLSVEEHGRRDGPKAGGGYSHNDLLTVVGFMLNPGRYLSSDEG